MATFATAWTGEHHFASVPAAVYGVVAVGAAIAYAVLQTLIVRAEGADSRLASALGADAKGKVSPLIYLAAIPLAFVNHWIAVTLYVIVALLWLVPDRRLFALFALEDAEPGRELDAS